MNFNRLWINGERRQERYADLRSPPTGGLIRQNDVTNTFVADFWSFFTEKTPPRGTDQVMRHGSIPERAPILGKVHHPADEEV
jgi:hypothetical protein